MSDTHHPDVPAVSRSTYVIIEALDYHACIHDRYNVYLTPWTSFAATLTDWAENVLEVDRPGSLRITVVQWTDEERDRWCEEHDIDWEGT